MRPSLVPAALAAALGLGAISAPVPVPGGTAPASREFVGATVQRRAKRKTKAERRREGGKRPPIPQGNLYGIPRRRFLTHPEMAHKHLAALKASSGSQANHRTRRESPRQGGAA